ncbi:hypothetical protein JL722_2585 [Aureococcus anophagefferens]|nr:hypothetical protein JL722_2585 [Aureococcus anophagefferens]
MSRPADQDGVPPQKDVENGVPPQDDVPKPQDDVPPPTTTELARVIDVVPQEGDLEAALVASARAAWQVILEELRGKDHTTAQELRLLEGGRFMGRAWGDGTFKTDQHQGLNTFLQRFKEGHAQLLEESDDRAAVAAATAALEPLGLAHEAFYKKVGHGCLLAAGTGILAFNKGKQKKGSANGKRKSEGGEPAAARPAAKRANPFISVEYPEAKTPSMLHGKDGTISELAAELGKQPLEVVSHVTYLLDLKKPVVKFTQDASFGEGRRPAPCVF